MESMAYQFRGALSSQVSNVPLNHSNTYRNHILRNSALHAPTSLVKQSIRALKYVESTLRRNSWRIWNSRLSSSTKRSAQWSRRNRCPVSTRAL
jgi:hypothetical protein